MIYVPPGYDPYSFDPAPDPTPAPIPRPGFWARLFGPRPVETVSQRTEEQKRADNWLGVFETYWSDKRGWR